ncbi:hypothetical protein GJ496_006285 [Pomphorhynchus laevis]|nr:hypothetical protein GJ496_006285 [Pomphorhynchus laevis]
MHTNVDYAQRSFRIDMIGSLKGHQNWVTQIATTRANEDIILSSSRDKTIIIWRVNPNSSRIGHAYKSLRGHGHFVSDIVFSSDGQYALSGSWDNTLRLWDLKEGKTTRRFVDHQKDVLSVAFSNDNRQIVSSSRDKKIKLWNTLGECKFTMSEDCNDWVSCVRFSSDPQLPIIVSCGWDKTVKVWNLQNCRLKVSHHGHTGYLNVVAVSPDGTLCASGGRDGKAILWDLNENKYVHSLDVCETINALCFSPKRYWLCVAAGSFIRIYDLENKIQVHEDLLPITAINDPKEDPSEDGMDSGHNKIAAPVKSQFRAECTSLAWSPNGIYLYAGYTDGVIRVWQVMEE